MDIQLRDEFTASWKKYFPGAELPVVFFFSAEPGDAEPVKPPAGRGHRCVIADLVRARRGASLCFDEASLGCPGACRFFGFRSEPGPEFRYFLSTGIPGKLEGERYKKTPELVDAMMRGQPEFKAPARHVIFKRWDRIGDGDSPEAAVFFAPPDVLAGLFALANFDEEGADAVRCPMSAGCGAIVRLPYLEARSPDPKCVLGMFDVSARPFVEENILTFAVPMPKMARMIGNMKESFLIAKSWAKLKARISSAAAKK
ncbi:MAG: DUF169 domain-containing protein [Planctomycetota bacterium]|nr:DUF169 domain-containing protein [Planctomycetota bacterium]